MPAEPVPPPSPRCRGAAGSLTSGGPSGPGGQIGNLESCFRDPLHVSVHSASQSCATGRPWDRKKMGEPLSLAPLLLRSSKISCNFSAPFIEEG